MRYATYRKLDGTTTWGVERDGRLINLGPSGAAVAATLKDAISAGALGVDDDGHVGADSVAIDDVEFLPPVDPDKILCIGVNYKTHQEETGRLDQKAPTVFTRFSDTQMGHGQPAVRPNSTTQFDYEGELALVIGEPAYRVSEADAWDVVAGYSVYNDFSVRDWQKASSQWTPGKNFPNTGAFGPFFVPACDIVDVDAMTLETRVNGETRQSASLSDLVFTIPQIIAFVTGFTALAPGDVIVTGTPGGVGMFMSPPGLLEHGDVVDVEISGVGTLTNMVVQE
jgi:2-keto-4-pentenoate hydratase/2-oxohepta-3-ene-1,7-dioic acid hydratase in catechol pathway